MGRERKAKESVGKFFEQVRNGKIKKQTNLSR